MLFAKDFFWTSTFMGSIVLRSDVINKILKESVHKKYLNSGFVLICSLLELLSERKMKVLVNCCHYYIPNPFKKEAIWMKDGKVFQIWAVDMPNAVNKLPKYYDSIKRIIIKSSANYNNYLNIIGIIRWRAAGVLNRTIFAKYKADLEHTSDVNIKLIELISLLPRTVSKFLFFPFIIRIKIRELGGRL